MDQQKNVPLGDLSLHTVSDHNQPFLGDIFEKSVCVYPITHEGGHTPSGGALHYVLPPYVSTPHLSRTAICFTEPPSIIHFWKALR